LEIAIETDDLLRQLGAREPDNVLWRKNLALNLSKIGDLWLEQRDVSSAHKSSSARTNYEKALAIDRALASYEPQNEDHSRRVSVGLEKLGNLQLHLSDESGARKSYEEALDIHRKLAIDYPTISTYQRQISSTLGKIAKLDIASSNVSHALQLYREKLTVDRQLREMDFNRNSQGDFLNIGLDLAEIGRLQLQIGHEQEGRNSYEESFDIVSGLFDRYPQNPYLIQQVSRIAIAAGNSRLRSGDAPGAAKSYEVAFDADLRAERSAHGDFLSFRSASKPYVEALGAISLSALLSNRPKLAAQYAESALALEPSEIATDVNRAHAYLLLGRYDEAKTIYLARKDMTKKSDSTKTYIEDIRDAFDKFRKLGIATPDCDRMAKEIGI
jgi:tetratricopeptide (TPR) repeat protein